MSITITPNERRGPRGVSLLDSGLFLQLEMTVPSEKNFAARRAEESHSWPPSGHQLTSTDLLARMGHVTDRPSELSTFLSFRHHSSRAQKVSHPDFARLWTLHELLSLNSTVKSCLAPLPQWFCLSSRPRARLTPLRYESVYPELCRGPVFCYLLISAPQGEFFLHLLQIQNGAILVITAKWNWGNHSLCRYS